jgi:hypothetical protein
MTEMEKKIHNFKSQHNQVKAAPTQIHDALSKFKVSDEWHSKQSTAM